MVVGLSSGKGRIPSALPPVLKRYAKDAIRTQPDDLISWSHSYFRALIEGESLPVKEKIEYPLPNNKTGISPGLMRVFHKKFCTLKAVPRKKFDDLCQTMGVKEFAATKAWKDAGGDGKVNWDQLLIQLVSQERNTPSEMIEFVMNVVCEDTTTKRVPVESVLKYLNLIAEESPIDTKILERTREYVKETASDQSDHLTPADLMKDSSPLIQ